MIIAAVAVAALGVYLLIIGAVALVGWLVAIAAKRETSRQAPQFVPASIPSAAPPPNQQFHVVLQVNPSAFDDPASLESSASSVFAAWARQLPKAPADPRDRLRSFTLRRRLIGRLTTKLDGRRFAWRAGPYRGRDRNLAGSPIDPSSFDPYNPPGDLRGRSSYLSLCRGCGGDGRIECTNCGGAARITCVACEGAGKVMGVTANGARRLLNCKTCKGKASLACESCSKGQVDCSTCQRSGRLENWLEVEGGPRDGDVQVEPDGDVTRAFVWGKDGVPASHDEIVRDARVVCAVTHDRLLTLDDLPLEVPSEWRVNHWQAIQARLQPGERVVSQTFTLLEVPSIEVTYAVGGDNQSIEFEGLRMLAPPVSTDHLFSARASALKRLAYVLGAVPLAVATVYLARGSYFVGPATAGVVFCAALAAATIYGVIWHASLRGSARKWLAGATIPITAATALAIVAEPSKAAARSYIDAGQLDRAKGELSALGDSSNDDLVPLWSDVYLKEALATTTCAAATERLSKIATSTQQRVKAQAHADALAVAASESALKSSDLDAARAALECAGEALRTGPAGRALQSRVLIAASRQCLGSKDWPCVLARANEASDLGAKTESEAVRSQALAAIRADVDSDIAAARTEKELASRVRLQRNAIDLWTRYLAKPDGEPTQLAALKAAAVKDEQALARQEQLAQQRREAEEKRQRDAQAREERKRAAEEERQKRREEAAARRSEPTGLLCCDGSLSPTCSCGGSHRGCCSHHGGVCGCQ